VELKKEISCKVCGETDLTKFYKRSDNGKYRTVCKECANKKSLEKYYANREDHLERDKKYRTENAEKISKRKQQYYLDNKDHILDRCANYRSEHVEERREYFKEYSKSNKEKLTIKGRFHSSIRRANKLNATPKWLSKEDKQAIKEIYLKASMLTKTTGITYHVDHIIPLVAADTDGNRVASGLHVPWNLQIITAEENLTKKNILQDNDIVYSSLKGEVLNGND
jgi:hypothetical protein